MTVENSTIEHESSVNTSSLVTSETHFSYTLGNYSDTWSSKSKFNAITGEWCLTEGEMSGNGSIFTTTTRNSHVVGYQESSADWASWTETKAFTTSRTETIAFVQKVVGGAWETTKHVTTLQTAGRSKEDRWDMTGVCFLSGDDDTTKTYGAVVNQQRHKETTSETFSRNDYLGDDDADTFTVVYADDHEHIYWDTQCEHDALSWHGPTDESCLYDYDMQATHRRQTATETGGEGWYSDRLFMAYDADGIREKVIMSYFNDATGVAYTSNIVYPRSCLD